ncbi:MAG: HD domain-containing phosphohydrolase [Clostridia bacterium]
MRKHLQGAENVENNAYRIIAVDDEEGIVDSLSIFLKRSGYDFTGVTDPREAIRLVQEEHFDLMILDFIMTPFHGDQVVEEIRKFNKDLYILLLTGHKDLAPPLDTIRRLDIQGYCEKSDKFDQLLLLIESGIKSIKQMRQIQDINTRLSDTYTKLEQAYLDSIETLRYTIEAKDMYTRGHSDRVAAYSVMIGEKLGLPEAELKKLELGGLFHDIGKIGVPDSILLKEARLTDEEYSQIKQHPNIGVHILSNASIFNDILPIVEHHHEKFDGSGYPSKLAGNDIPFLARIATIADSFDAMASKRAYRNSLDIKLLFLSLKM